MSDISPVFEQNTRGRLAVVAVVLVIAITVVHFFTDAHEVAFHNVYRRLSYVPIVMGAFAYGVRGGIGLGVFAGLAYVPHAFFAVHADPAPAIDKVLEIVLYITIGALTGWLVERQRNVQTELERSLVERDALESQLVRAGKLSALGELTAGLAHEIRNPLASISGSAEAVADVFDEEHPVYPMVTVLLREIRRLDKVVSDFLEFARPSHATRVPTDLKSLAKEVIALCSQQSEDLGIVVSGPRDSIEVSVDPDQAKQVIINLVLNAFDACEEVRQPHVTIDVIHRQIGGRSYGCVRVRDNGRGVPDDLRERVFDPYVTTRETGTGLGLSISNRIMESHEGLLELESADDGTSFLACFPIEP